MTIRWKILIVALVVYSIAATTLILQLLDRLYAFMTNGVVKTLDETEASHTLRWIHVGVYVLAVLGGVIVLAEVVGRFIADDTKTPPQTSEQ